MDSINWRFAVIAILSLIQSSHAQFYWSYRGPIAGKSCTRWLEPSDPHTWHDNYLCSNANWNARWSYRGPIAGMRCTQIREPSDPHTWHDNYYCVPNDSPLTFTWSNAGNNCGGRHSVQVVEPSDPHTWNDNFLCWQFKKPQFYWSSAGPIGGKTCVRWLEAADPHTWHDNYLCSDKGWGIRWSSAGAIPGMKCTQIVEAADPHTWHDNYLCVPPGSPLTFRWSSAGNTCGGDGSVQIREAADPHTWHDNYLCWSFNDRADDTPMIQPPPYSDNPSNDPYLVSLLNNNYDKVFEILVIALFIFSMVNMMVCINHRYKDMKGKKGYEKVVKYDSESTDLDDVEQQ